MIVYAPLVMLRHLCCQMKVKQVLPHLQAQGATYSKLKYKAFIAQI